MTRSKDPLAPQPEPKAGRKESAEIIEAIIEATITIGDPDASVNAIAERAGVGIASLYRYFPSKAAILAEISRRLQREFLVGLKRVLEEPGLTVAQAIEQVCRVAIYEPGASPEIRYAINVAVPMSWSHESARAMYADAQRELEGWLRGKLDPVPADLQHRVFVAFAAARGVVMVSRAMPAIAPPDEALVRMLVTTVRACLLGPDDPPG